MKLTLNKAARLSGRSKSTLLNAIKKGRLSATKEDSGHYAIDPAELHRAFPFDHTDRSSNRPIEQPSTTVLERENELLREMLTKAEANADHWRELAQRQQALLTDQRPVSRRWWPWGR